jgi:hypothetical protein
MRCITSSIGCIDTSDICTLYVADPISINLQLSQYSMQVGDSVEIAISASGGNDLEYSWQIYTLNTWLPINSIPSSALFYDNTETNTLHIFGINQPNQYLYRCVVSSSTNGCGTMTSSPIVLFVCPQISVITQTTAADLCTGGSTVISAAGQGYSNLLYNWQYNNGGQWSSIHDGQPVGADYSLLGSQALEIEGIMVANEYNYRCLVTTSLAGCPGVYSDNISLTVLEQLNILHQSGNDTICIGGTDTLSIVVSGGDSLTYQWQTLSGSGWQNIGPGTITMGTISDANSPELIIANTNIPGTGFFRAIAHSNVNGCYDAVSDSICLTAYQVPSITAQSSHSTICVGDTQILTVSASGGHNLHYYWQYYNGSSWDYINSDTTSGLSYSGAGSDSLVIWGLGAPGNYNYRCFVRSDVSDCPEVISGTIALTIRPRPQLSNSIYSQSLCSGDNSQFVVLTSNYSGTEYFWSATYASNGVTGFLNNNQNPSNIIPIQTLYNNGASQGSVVYSITTVLNGCEGSDTLYTFYVNPLPNANAGIDLELCLGDTASLSPSGGETYFWTPTTGLSNPTSASTLAYPNATTHYSLIAYSNTGCSGSDDITITVHTLPIAHAVANDTIICIGESVALYASGGIAYSWSPAATINYPYLQTPVAVPQSNTTYYVSVTDINNCSSMDSVAVRVEALPLANAGADHSICIGQTATLEASGGGYYLWSTGDTTHTIMATPAITTSYILTVTSTTGCESIDEAIVVVHGLPLANAGNDATICESSSIELTGTGGTSYSWFPTNTLNNPLSPTPIAEPLSSTLYVLEVVDSFGCQGFDSVLISVMDNPDPLIIGKTNVCANENWVAYSVQTGNNVTWEVLSGEIQIGQHTNKIFIRWYDTGAGKVIVREQYWGSPYCTSSDTLEVEIGEIEAPNLPSIVLKAENLSTGILMCQFCNYSDYQWGYESKVTGSEVVTCSGKDWCQYDLLDTIMNSYWLIVSYGSGCTTKAYFNPPDAVVTVQEVSEGLSLSVYPNPADLYVNVTLEGPYYNKLRIRIITLIGTILFESVEEKRDFQHTQILPLKDIPPGLYFLDISISNKYATKRFIRL